MKKKIAYKKILLAGIINENPVFVALLGMCSTLATTKSIEAAFGMGILVLLVLIGSNVLISLLRKIIPQEAKIPCYIVIIATFVTIVKMLCQAFIPGLYSGLGVFISLIVVNCIILGRAEAFASKNGVAQSFVDAVGQGIGFTIALCVMAIIREILGTGAITIGAYFPLSTKIVIQLLPKSIAIPLFVQSAGGFLTLGCVLAFLAWQKNRKDAKKAALEKERIETLKKEKQEALAKAKEEANKAKAKEVEQPLKEEDKRDLPNPDKPVVKEVA
jgi:electron transport complex protein RnfE